MLLLIATRSRFACIAAPCPAALHPLPPCDRRRCSRSRARGGNSHAGGVTRPLAVGSVSGVCCPSPRLQEVDRIVAGRDGGVCRCPGSLLLAPLAAAETARGCLCAARARVRPSPTTAFLVLVPLTLILRACVKRDGSQAPLQWRLQETSRQAQPCVNPLAPVLRRGPRGRRYPSPPRTRRT